MPTHFLYIIDILGTISFAVSGAFLAMEKKLDPFGVLVISFVTAIGGGTLRDILIGNLPVSWLQNETATVVIFCSAVVTMFFGKHLKHLSTTLFLFDALGLGLFTIVGIKLGIAQNFSIGVCITLGTITACFGGVVRDVLLNNIPLLKLDADVITILCILIIFAIRILAVRYKISLPQLYNKAEKEQS